MNDQSRFLNRRLVIGLWASAIAWSFGGPFPSLVSKRPNLPISLRPLLLSLFGNLQSACAIGAACSNSLRHEDVTEQQLTKKIFAAASCGTEAIKGKEATRRWIANQVRCDFAQGAIISVDGWLLSLTEARVYALVNLASSSEARLEGG
jgi:hypothetical protein